MDEEPLEIIRIDSKGVTVVNREPSTEEEDEWGLWNTPHRVISKKEN